jgi:hypothetical protein
MFYLNSQLEPLNCFTPNFSDKRRMRPARSVCADRDSMSAFILCFAGMKAFLF